MLEKCRILYKGDMIAGSFYVFVGIILLLFAITLHYFTESIGYQYLTIGFFMFLLYCVGKGTFIYFISRKKHLYYWSLSTVSPSTLKSETEYTEYRITKKNINRRRYLYTTVIFTVLAFLGIFSPQKGIIMGTAIPIALISGIEMAIGLLTEFRLREFHRILLKG